ncbi:UDP-N-acetylmuramoyl-tripeptide--D-alanyl-D-alanine ligase [Riemerella anatipestifer]|uniref:UDP-N-acetylmuramoyl-tripeptide--D-alanyl-D- alanine ligase n=1 Tax=Riemerella anatipestifer TaxID=34085 RepID=UPI00129DCF01|nr:UDP-N-acetylmuramoyl-tripeptide--D-alanyl-D-alanine ligase [Riemerella anatipestifer]MRM96897.1 UDP-N-acetylmuramoyl-tripeptide--D-alanyl-D-alanine ligase [Riemerella anatipestifer]MRN00894.1 UDP-N-acetylmuramoyl-tripeptide--D-alanyl-D-alanine ligase [Riemerella anatipestifer]MRN03061.1 UDP-N-acetylmuramoyl-tripeptide--D-alanyl-D-alanine ligase [Riemerella anatipestifer]
MNIEQFYPIYLKSNKVSIDSRTIAEGDLFFAFSGENFNAATLAEDAINKGALAVIVEQKEYENISKNIFYVPSTLKFLQELSTFHRNKLNIPIIALTGSNGKTTSKELIAAVLSKKYKVQFTKGNLNNHIGVPLTLLSIKPEHEITVVEMGANHQKEIELLCQIAQPDYGYVTNFGKAHLEGFGGIEGVIKGKSELYDYLKKENKQILVNANDTIQVEKTKDYSKTICFGTSQSDYDFQLFYDNQRVGLIFESEEMMSQLTGAYNFTNISAAVTLGLHFGIDKNLIKEAIQEYTPTNMRSQIMQKGDKTLVLDTYNANPSSMAVSLENFALFNGSKTVIIGDMLELGDASKEEHKTILQKAQSLNFDKIITVGKHFSSVNTQGTAFLNTQQLSEYLKNQPLTTKNILLKGSRGIALEKILDDIV